MKNPKNILISGASSGIGKQLAISYAKKNINSKETINLFLLGRNKKRLEEVKKICQDNGAKVKIKDFDIKNGKECQKFITEIEKRHEIDLIIANAGISAGTDGGPESFAQIKEIFDVNVNGVINLTHPAIEKMKTRRRGQIAIISSLAGFRGLPSSPAYSASKAAVRVYAEGLRGNLSKLGIQVNTICPGYIKTPMTDVNEFPMPFLMSAPKCAKKIIKGLEKNKSRISFPFPLFFTVWLCTLLSNKITDPIFAKLPGKKSI